MLKIENKADIFHYRTLLFVLFFSISILLSRYFYLQVIDYERYSSKSQVNSIRAKATYAPRGLILDRNGVVLVENYPTYILTVTPYKLSDKDSQFKVISEITDISIEELNRRYKKYNQGRFLPTVIAKNLTFAEISQIEERRLELKGFQYKRFDERLYNDVLNDAHFLGYLRELDRESLPFLDKSQLYRAGELIGWQGVEKQYEKQLRYSKGVEYIEVDTFGREINRINENNIPAYPGNNLILSIDARLQQFSKNLLNDKKGVILISDVDTGETLTVSAFSDTSAVLMQVNLESSNVTAYLDIDWFGSSSISVEVSDGFLADTSSFILTVNPVNDAPTIVSVQDTSILEDSTVDISFDVMDVDSFEDLTLEVFSDTNTVSLKGFT